MIRKFFTLFGTIGIFVGGIIFIMALGAMRPKVETQEPEITPPTVFYEIAKTQSVTLDVSAQGEVRPRTDINLTAQVAGRVTSTSDNFVNGGAFENGETLLRIEDADYRVAVTASRARVAQAEEALRREEAEAALAERDYKDLGLGEDPSDLTLRVPQLAQARANYDAAKADLSAAELNLSRTRVKAQFKGRVRERIAGPGQYVTPGTPLGRVFSTDVAEIRLPLTDADLAKLGVPIAFVADEENPGPEVRLQSIIAGEQHEWLGRIERTDGAIDPTTRQISAIAVVDDPYGKGADNGVPLTIGLFVDASISGKPYDNAIVLPRRALYGRDTIYVINSDAQLEERKVAVISSDRDTITISTGIADGDRVAVSPLRGSGAGDTVIPTDPTASNKPNAATLAGTNSSAGNGGVQ